MACIRKRVCWICGQPLGRFMTFVVGPMCTVNRVSSEPPSHLDCAYYAVQVCPFLSIPETHRVEAHLPDDRVVPGIAIDRNPGVTCAWTTKEYSIFKVSNGILFSIGEPTEVEWYMRGRPATRGEVMASIQSGLPFLHNEAEKEGPVAIKELREMYNKSLHYIPSGD
jgi:hypothetical protein